jgi:predicted dehydrogenase
MTHLALIGCGGIVQGWHGPTLAKIADCNVVALADPARANLDVVRTKFFPEAAPYDSLESLLERPPAKLDAVLITTPHALHYPQATAALERGLHVLVEKPMVTSTADAMALWKTVKRTGKLLGITFQAPYTKAFQYLRDERDAGRLGAMQIVHAWISQSWAAGTKGKWRQEPKLAGGGMLYDTGAHMLNAILWLTNRQPIEVACTWEHCDCPVDINGAAMLRFENCVLASCAVGGNCPPWGSQLVVQTDKFQILTTNHGGELKIIAADGKAIEPKLPVDDRPSAFSPHRNFLDAIQGKAEIQVPVRFGVLLANLMEAMSESARQHTMVKVPAVPAEI